MCKKTKELTEKSEKLIRTINETEAENLLFTNSRRDFHIERNKWEECFQKFLKDCGFDIYGRIDDDRLEKYLIIIDGDETAKIIDGEDIKEHAHAFDNGLFRIMPYWLGNSENIAKMPNFIYYPTGYELQWYKYPLRGAYANQDICFDRLKEILEICKKSCVSLL